MIPPQLWLNDGTGVFSMATGRLPFPLEDLDFGAYTASEFIDVNNDTLPDLILGDAGDDLAGGSDSLVLLNDGTGYFSLLDNAVPPKPFAVSDYALDIHPADLNGDGYQDLLIAYTKGDPWYVGRYVQVLINNQDGTFRDETGTRLPQPDNNDPFIYQLQSMDIDRDQDMDLVARP